ncbi:outer membrane protein assembly factor BamB family protein [Streptomyces sp. NBC_01244]|uniref:outer membrane protein assembly factor BamB family protein n=1 Tax=Streptomyces sp. NBC_01244 TaxID=2903797 RepID=UPI002E14F2F0|nr:PQQ-binding-like beta-propeller repeat protein [Streptomyces sp. NBC_01244]
MEAASPNQSGGINPPVASDRHVFDFEERITAVDLVTGAVAWKLEPEGTKLLSAPVCVNGTVYVADGALQAFDESTGKKVWTHDPGAYVSMLVVQRGSRLYPQTVDRLAAVPLD